MAKPTIADLLPGASISENNLVIPSSLFVSVGLDAANFVPANGSKIAASILIAISQATTGKDEDIDYSLVATEGFDSISTRSDGQSYEVGQLSFNLYRLRPSTGIDPDDLA